MSSRLYTSYYGMLKQIARVPELAPVAISRVVPKFFTGPQLECLAPSWELVNQYKYGSLTEEEYTNRYTLDKFMPNMGLSPAQAYLNDTVNLEPHAVLSVLRAQVGGGRIPVLLCYEKAGTFCHRHLVSKWFQGAGIPCTEWQKP